MGVPMAKCQSMMKGEISWACDVINHKKTVEQVYKELLPMLKPKKPFLANPAELLEQDDEEYELARRRGPGPCINAQDEKHYPDIVQDMTFCGESIKKYHYHGLKELGKIRECLIEQKGFTKDCSVCTAGGLGACRVRRCSKTCGNPAKLYEEDCFTCQADCVLDMAKCSGIDGVPMAKCQSMMKGEISWACDVINHKTTVEQIYKELYPKLKPQNLVALELDLAELGEAYEQDPEEVKTLFLEE